MACAYPVREQPTASRRQPLGDGLQITGCRLPGTYLVQALGFPAPKGPTYRSVIGELLAFRVVDAGHLDSSSLGVITKIRSIRSQRHGYGHGHGHGHNKHAQGQGHG